MSICILPTDITPAGVITSLHYCRLQTYDTASDWEEHFHESFGSIHNCIVRGVNQETLENAFTNSGPSYDKESGIWKAVSMPGVSPWAQIAGICSAFSDLGGLGQYWPGDRGYCRRAVECCFDVIIAYQLVPDAWISGAFIQAELAEYCDNNEITAPLLRT